MKLLKLILLNILSGPAFVLWWIGIAEPDMWVWLEIDRVNGIEREPRK